MEPGALFHIRIAIDRREERATLLTTLPLAESLMEAARFYEERKRWHITVFLLMPDHLHALLAFQRDDRAVRAR